MPEQDEQDKVYPGNIARYNAVRALREGVEKDYRAGTVQVDTLVGAIVAEELTGLAYILDGIRYSARQMQGGSR